MRSFPSLHDPALSTAWTEGRACARVRLALVTALALVGATLAGCGGDGNYVEAAPVSVPPMPTASYAIGGTTSGLKGSGLVLQNNAGDDLPIASDGTFRFAAPMNDGQTYLASVKTAPTNPTQTCSVGNAGGSVHGADIIDINVVCSQSTFVVGGKVTGLAGAGLVVQNNDGDDLAIGADGAFTFPVKVASGARYAVTVKAQPGTPAQTCTVTHAAGTVVDRNVDDVAIVCATDTYTIGGTVSGLSGAGLVLQNNAADDLAITGEGTFVFNTPVASGSAALVTVKTPPVGHACTVAHRPAPVTANVTDVRVICSPFPLTVGGTITGMTGTGLVLRNNGVDDLVLLENGSFTFAKPVAYGAPYVVSVAAQPSFSQCAVSNGSATATANVTNLSIVCTPEALQVTTLAGSGTMATIDGAGTAASFHLPSGIASDAAGNLYVVQQGDGALRKISPSGDVTTLVRNGLYLPFGVAVSPSGEIFVAAAWNQIMKVSQAGHVTLFAGSGIAGSEDGNGAYASFNGPWGLAFDSVGNLYVSDSQGHRIRRVSSNGDVTTLAGSGLMGGIDGSGAEARFSRPANIAVGPDGNVYVAEVSGRKIRKITPAGVVTTLAGSGSEGSADGDGIAATFNGPSGIAVDAAGAVYVADAYAHKVRRIDPSGVVTTLAGTGLAGSTNGAASTATFGNPIEVLVDAQGNLVVADLANSLIRKISR